MNPMILYSAFSGTAEDHVGIEMILIQLPFESAANFFRAIFKLAKPADLPMVEARITAANGSHKELIASLLPATPGRSEKLLEFAQSIAKPAPKKPALKKKAVVEKSIFENPWVWAGIGGLAWFLFFRKR